MTLLLPLAQFQPNFRGKVSQDFWRWPVPRQRYRIEFYKGKVSPETKVESTTVRAIDEIAAREFGKMRRPGLIVVVTPAPKEKRP